MPVTHSLLCISSAVARYPIYGCLVVTPALFCIGFEVAIRQWFIPCCPFIYAIASYLNVVLLGVVCCFPYIAASRYKRQRLLIALVAIEKQV